MKRKPAAVTTNRSEGTRRSVEEGGVSRPVRREAERGVCGRRPGPSGGLGPRSHQLSHYRHPAGRRPDRHDRAAAETRRRVVRAAGVLSAVIDSAAAPSLPRHQRRDRRRSSAGSCHAGWSPGRLIDDDASAAPPSEPRRPAAPGEVDRDDPRPGARSRAVPSGPGSSRRPREDSTEGTVHFRTT